LPNNTLTSGYAAHIGQAFWDQDIINEIEATAPYSSNTVAITENADDRVVGNEVTNTDSDPFFNYVYLGDSVEDGLFGWITIGINTSASYTPTYSFEYTEEGGVAVGDSSGAGGAGGGGGMTGGPPGGTGTFGNATASMTGTTSSTTVTSTASSTTSSASATVSSNSGPS
jgi:hypothetical protein